MSATNFSIDKSINVSHVIYMLFLLGTVITVYSSMQTKLEVHSTQITSLQEGLKSFDKKVSDRADRTDDKIDRLRTTVEQQLGKR